MLFFVAMAQLTCSEIIQVCLAFTEICSRGLYILSSEVTDIKEPKFPSF